MRFANLAGRLTYIPGSGEQLAGAAGVDVHIASGGVIPARSRAGARALGRRARMGSGRRRGQRPGGTGRGGAGVARGGIPAATPDLRRRTELRRPRRRIGFLSCRPNHSSSPRFSGAVTGPYGEIALRSGTVDWEVEVAVVIGRRAEHIGREHAWNAVAGLTVGQDLSDRDIQMRPSGSPQFGLGKSLPGFAPLGPLLVTPDALASPNDLELRCTLNDEEVQHSRSSRLIFSHRRADRLPQRHPAAAPG